MTVEQVTEVRKNDQRRGVITRRLVLHHAVDPMVPDNAAVVDLDRAEQTAHGLVRFDHDVVVVEPADPDRANGWALIDVVNRGRPTVPGYLHLDDSPPFPLPAVPPLGDGLLLDQGFTVVHVGWQFDVEHRALLGLRAPSLAGSPPPKGRVEYVLSPATAAEELPLNLPGHRPYRVAEPESATLFVDHPDGAAEEIDRSRWSFAADGRRLRVGEGFVAGVKYRISYETDQGVVAGTGLLALRDVVPWLRTTRPVRSALLFGVSQCGRVIRQFLADGFNRADGGGRAYDAMLPVIAGGRLGAFNERFAVPGALPQGAEGLREKESLTTYGDLLGPSDRAGVTPKVIALNTSTEYWRGDAALVHGDPHEAVRVHHVAGTQHSAGLFPQQFEDPYLGTKGQHGFNTVDYRPVLRALVTQLVSWVDDDLAPAAGVVPTPDQCSTRAQVLDLFARRGIAVPDTTSFDQPDGPVPAIDSTGNEVGGIHLPDVAVPVGVHTGWNVRHPDCGAPRERLMLRGSTWWLEDVGALEPLLGRVREVISDLVDRRLILAGDAALLERQYVQRHGAAMEAARPGEPSNE